MTKRRTSKNRKADLSNEIAAVYARYSDRGQNETSIEQQFEKCDELAAQLGVSVRYRYSDKAMTGRNDNRPDFQRMMRDAEKGEFAVLLAWKSNRLGRNMMDIMTNEELLRRRGVRTYYVMANFEDTAAGRFAARMMMNNDQYYSEALAEDVMRGMMYNAERCKANGPLPDGYTSDKDGNIIIDEPRAAIIREIFQRVLDGENMRNIRRDLIARGITNNRGQQWGKNAIYKIITNERYRGIYTFADVRIEGGMPRIVSDADFYRIQDYLRSKPNPRSRRRGANDYLLTGKLYCGHCKAPMTGFSGISHTGDSHYYYSCTTRRRQGAAVCAKKSVRKEQIEQAVAEYIRDKILMDDKVVEWIANQVVDYAENQAEKSELGLLRTELAETERGLNNLLKAIEQGIITPTTKSRMEALEADKARLAAKVAAAEASLLSVDRDDLIISMRVMRKLNVTDPKAQELLFDTFLQSVYLYDDHLLITLNFTDEKPLNVDFNPDDFNGESEGAKALAEGSPKAPFSPPENRLCQTAEPVFLCCKSLASMLYLENRHALFYAPSTKCNNAHWKEVKLQCKTPFWSTESTVISRETTTSWSASRSTRRPRRRWSSTASSTVRASSGCVR